MTGAPSTPNVSFEEYVLSDALGFQETLREYWINLKCVRQVISEDASPEVKALWATYKAKLEELRDNDWARCKKIDNVGEQQK